MRSVLCVHTSRPSLYLSPRALFFVISTKRWSSERRAELALAIPSRDRVRRSQGSAWRDLKRCLDFARHDNGEEARDDKGGYCSRMSGVRLAYSERASKQGQGLETQGRSQ